MKTQIALLATFLVCFAAAQPCFAADAAFAEKFALAEDREEILKELIPGTEDYYFYHCLHYQNTGKFDEVDAMLRLWIERHNRSVRVREIQNRQAIFRHASDPRASLEYLRRELGLYFNHQREIAGRRTNLPTVLDAALISREALTRRAFSWHKDTVQGFENASFEWLIEEPLDEKQRRDLLQRLTRPDYANLPRHIVDDLKAARSGGFGSLNIHRYLLLAQLDEVLRLKPDLLSQSNFVNVYLARLRPGADTDWRYDETAREAYLDRLESFVMRLNDSHNSLKAHVLYHRLLHERAQDTYDKQRFMRYLQLPRSVFYVNQDYIRRRDNRGVAANMNQDFSGQTAMPIVGNDEPLVRDYLQRFFVDEDSYEPYSAYLEDNYLKEVFAETKIVNGLGDMEQWYSLMTPAKYAALRDRIDLDFDPSNKTLHAADEEVRLDLWIKNIDTLIVKVFEINTENYYRRYLREINTDIDLDGLVANDEEIHTYDEVALRRLRRTFAFPDLTERGVYVIEFIGNGKSSRALIRKGRLDYVMRTSVAGHIFTILDDSKEKLADAALWIDGHEYLPDDDGTIAVPLSNAPGRQPIVLSHGSFAYLDHFNHESEEYSLSAGIHVDRESLRRSKEARVIVRPSLYLNGTPVTVTMLENTALVITSTDREGISTSRIVQNFELSDDEDSVHTFRVPDDLMQLTFTLQAKAENLSQHRKVDLAASRTFSLNHVDTTQFIEAMHLSRMNNQYIFELLDKSGFPMADRPIHFSFKHKHFRDHVTLSLQTDDEGRINLGTLTGIDFVRANHQNGTERSWNPSHDAHNYPAFVHGRTGTPLAVPYMGAAPQALRSELSLLERRGGSYYADRFDALSVEDGYIVISEVPAGDYTLFLKPWNTQINLRIGAGPRAEGYVHSAYRRLEMSDPAPLQLSGINTARREISVQLKNYTDRTRVHFIATRFMPAYSAYTDLGGVSVPEPYMRTVPPGGSVYISGRNIGDEYRYILERKYARKFPGNTLDRPGLLINPWAIRKTETEQQFARPGEAPRASAEPEEAFMSRSPALMAPAVGGIDFANLDFLSGDAVVLANLQPDENGIVTIERDVLGGRQHLHVVAVDPVNTVYRQVALKEDPILFQDLRLARGLDPASHSTQQKQITYLRAGDTLVIEDMTSSRIEAYDTIAKVFRLFTTLSKDATLAEFEFVTRWPELSDEEKRAKYSKYASHELNFFLSRKDPEFFSAAVQPYTRHKVHKTFLDRWLIEDDLDTYFDPWAHAQLNIVEKILLAERVAGERTPTARFVADQFNLLPPNIDLFNRLFLTGIQGSALEFRGGVGGAFDLRAGLERFDYADDADMQAINGRLRGVDVASNEPMLKNAARQLAASKSVARGAVADEISVMTEGKASLDVIGGRKKEFESGFALAEQDIERRSKMRQFYQKLDKTREWVENNYYHLPIEVQNANLITVNALWRDYATRNPNEAFVSTNVAEASRNFAEMMLALAVIDLPFTAGEHETQLEEDRYTVTAASPMIVFHEEIREAGETDDTAPVLVSQNFFRQDDRYRYVENEPVDNFITGEFLVNVVYGCQVTVTNPGSGRQKLDVLLQVPRGSLPSLNGKYTRSHSLTLEPYSTQAIVYHFYFPKEGDFLHYPVHVSRNGRLIAQVDPQPMHVLLTPSSVDTASWDYISQNGNEQDVVNFLNANNINRTNLDRIAWRMRDRDFFGTIRELLRARHAYNNTLWGYAVMHNDIDAMREFLQHQDGFVAQCGAYIDAPLLTIDPVIRKSYQHMEYKPLVNARAHRLGPQRKILNDRFREQYARLMNVLSYRPLLNGDDLMSVTQYMLTQDRIEEALDFFGKVRPGALNARIQYDYFDAYLAFYDEDLARAREIAERYADHPVDRWKNLFAAAANQLEEIEGAQTRVADAESRGQRQDLLAASETNFDFSVESRKVDISYQNATRATVNYYVMDLELLFSRNPFVKEYSDHFLTVYPNLTEHLTLDPDSGEHTIDLPDQLHNSNVMIEIEMGGVKKSEAYYAHSLTTRVVENYGQVVVTHGDTGAPLSKVYVKVFARMQDGDVRFYKDGYTDLRGRFDYTSLNTNELDFVQEFSMLIMSETDGAVVREARPPKR